MADHDFVELLWQHDNLVLQSHSKRPKRSSSPSTQQEKVVCTQSVIQNPQGDDFDVPYWVDHYPNIEDPLPQDYCTEFFSEFPGGAVDVASLPPSSKPTASIDFSQAARDSHVVESIRIKSTSTTAQLGSGSSSSSSKSTRLGLSEALMHSRFQKQEVACLDPLPNSSRAGVMNFSHFSRPVAVARANLQSAAAARSGGDTSCGRAVQSNLLSSTLTETNGGSKSVSVVRGQSAPVLPTNVVSTSGCSGDSVEAVSVDPNPRGKRKICEYVDPEDPVSSNKDVVMRGGNVKRSRAADVHNLSERRRRDRINEKIRALQELVPNCNKVDKASILDEAIEYLQTLQLQIQMVSMQNGLCKPPMMPPAGMQLTRMPAMYPFLSMGMGIGRGVGLGYGIGMYDMSSVPRFPLIPVQPMQGQQLPRHSIPVAPDLQGTPGSTFGSLGQGLPASIPGPPLFCSPSGVSTRASPVYNVSRTPSRPTPAADVTPSFFPKDQSIDKDTTQKKSTNDSPSQKSNQAVKECFKSMSIRALQNTGKEVLNSLDGNGVTSTGTSSCG